MVLGDLRVDVPPVMVAHPHLGPLTWWWWESDRLSLGLPQRRGSPSFLNTMGRGPRGRRSHLISSVDPSSHEVH